MSEPESSRHWFVVATLLLGVGGMVGVLMPWAQGFRWSSYGFEYIQGVAALVGALWLAIVSILRASRRIGDIEYATLGVAACLLSLGSSLWFWSSEVGAEDQTVQHLLISFFEMPRISAGVGLYVTGSSTLAGLLCVVGFAVNGRPLQSGFRLVHDERNFNGGSLIPNRFRVRIVRRAHTAP
jgi:hypothetical protein